jgi:lipopolysaccharide export system permease protein
VFRVPILQRYVLREAATGYAITALLLLGLLVLGGGATLARKAEGVGASLMLRLLPDLVVSSAWMALPIALMLSVAFTFSRLAADGELDAMRASGVPARHLLPPVILLGLMTTAILLPLVGNVQPRSVHRMRTTVKEGLRFFLMNPRPGPFSIDTPTLVIAWSDLRDGHVRDLTILTTPDIADLEQLFVASEARIAYDDQTATLRFDVDHPDVIQFEKITAQRAPEAGTPRHEYHVTIDRVERWEIPLEGEFERNRKLANLTLNELYGLGEAWDDDAETGLPPRIAGTGRLRSWAMKSHWTELARRYFIPWAPLLFVLVAAPMGAWVRKSSRLVAFAAAFIPVLILYWPLLSYAESLGKAGRLDPVSAMAIPHGAVLLLGVSLIGWKCWR